MPSIFPNSNTGTLRTTRKKMLPACVIMAGIMFLSFLLNRPLGDMMDILSNPGLYIDLLALLFLIFILWSATRVEFTHLAVYWVRYGLLLWIIGATFDVMDEIVVQPKWVGYFCEDVTRLAGMLMTAIGVYKIIKRINKLYVNAHSLSLRDELTQLPNRRFFIDTIKSKMNKPLALMILDIDYFKKINDTYGHLVGDEVLFNLGKQLAGIGNDTIQATRIGGEEFAIIVDGLSQDEVKVYALSILENVRKILINNEHPLSVSIGIGFNRPGESQDAFIKKVDQALYRAKDKGRGRIEWTVE